MKEGSYVVLQEWMITKLNLKGSELIAYALIYGFSQDGESRFTGSLNYIAGWLNMTRPSTSACLKSLVNKGYIIKTDVERNGVKFCEYSANIKILEKLTGEVRNFPTPRKETFPNNKENNIDNLPSEGDKPATPATNVTGRRQLIPTIGDEKKQLDAAKKEAKKKNILEMKSMISSFTDDEDVRAALKEYFNFRVARGLDKKQWEAILEGLRERCGTNKEEALEVIRVAYAAGHMSLTYGKKTSAGGGKGTYRYEQTRPLVSVSDMSEEERAAYLERRKSGRQF